MFLLAIFSTASNDITARSSIDGTRRDLRKSLGFAAEGPVRAHSHRARLGDVNTVFADLKNDKVDCRMILTLDLAAFIAHASRMELLPLARSVNQ